MKYILDYKIKEKIHEGIKNIIYRAYCQSDNQLVILKVLNKEYPTTEELVQFKYEYEILQDINMEGVIKALSLEKYQNSLVMVMRDCGEESLNKYLQGSNMKLDEFLPLAIQLADILGKLHEQNIIHKDLNPSNMIWNHQTKKVSIIDFGMATRLASENFKAQSTNMLGGTLPYISPEQTGRMNRSVDYRTDFYSLGVTFYEMLLGVLPFQSEDPVEIIHGHIAKQPIPPYKLNPNISKTISEIILKLMAKMAEDRYQSGLGLKKDLEKCLEQFKMHKKIDDFIIGQNDVSPKFTLSEKLYGRETETEILMAMFEKVCAGSTELMLVTGYPGIGKSALVYEIQQPIIKRSGYFIFSKCNQFKQNTPYYVWRQVFGNLVRQILTESEKDIANWKKCLLEAVGDNGQIIIEFIPETELILGKQPPVEKLAPKETQNRFNLVFGNFVRTLATAEHSLVIFFDDLQWMDLASLKFLEQLITDSETQYLFIIGAYRDNEVNLTHQLVFTCNEIQKKNKEINTITVEPLDLPAVLRLVEDTLKCSNEVTEKLTDICLTKTSGNPFFLRQFLIALYEQKIIKFDFTSGTWMVDMVQAQSCSITDNVLDLLLQKLQQFKEDTQSVLKLAACIGEQFDLQTLALINGKTLVETAADLQEALKAGAILPIDDTYKFMHDSVQRAAYVLIGDDVRQSLHLKIGRLLLKRHKEEGNWEEQIFTILSQINTGVQLITDREERLEVVRLNLFAAKKAKNSVAYYDALQFLTVGMGLLDKDSWDTYYELTMELYKERAEVEYLNGNFTVAEEMLISALRNSQEPLDSVVLYGLLIMLYGAMVKYEEAVSVGKKALKLLGVELPSEEEWPSTIAQKVAAIQEMSVGDDILSIVDRPAMTDQKKIAAINILKMLVPISYYVSPTLSALLSSLSVEISLKYGNAPQSPTGYSGCAIFLCALGDYQTAYKIALAAVKLSELFESKPQKARANMVLGAYSLPWQQHIKYALEILTEGYEAGLTSGEIEFMGYCLLHKMQILFMQGLHLNEIAKMLPQYMSVARKIKHQVAVGDFLAIEMVVMNLLGRTPTQLTFATESTTEEEMLQLLEEGKMYVIMGWYFIFKLQALYMLGEFAAARECERQVEKMFDYSKGHFLVSLGMFYQSLTLLAVLPTISAEEQMLYQEKIKSNQEQMKMWADNCPANFLHKYLLVEAERAKLSKHNWQAMELYNQAIVLAGQNGFIQEEALANELMAEFWLSNGKEEVANVYIRKAFYGYQLWGATRKVEMLKNKYPNFINNILTNQTKIQEVAYSSTSTVALQTLDLASMIKLSNTIAGEMDIATLLHKMMHISLENAGAENGFFILEKKGELVIEAEGGTEQVLRSIPLKTMAREEGGKLSSVIVNYVARFKKNVVLDDAANQQEFAHDPYIKMKKPQSILCMPLIKQGKLVAILYLENNLVKGAFTSERLSILEILSSQMAISLENALLYANLEERVVERTKELSIAMDNLQQAQSQLIHSEKMAALGNLVAGVAHEMNTPVGAAKAAAEEISSALGSLSKLPEMLYSVSLEIADKICTLIERGLTNKRFFSTREERQYKRQLRTHLEAEAVPEAMLIAENLVRMGICDNIDEWLPLFKEENITFIMKIVCDVAVQRKNVENIRLALDKTSKIIFALKSYSHFQSDDQPATIVIQDGLETVLTIYNNQLKYGIEVIQNFNAVPEIMGYPDQLTQVWTNIIHNAIQAMSGKGKLAIDLCQENDHVVVRITDNGPGIAPETMARIFEPFFTTKKSGEGSGLGLDICRRIVEKHQGRIAVESEPGKTTFAVYLPVNGSL